jgi:hypothetical protein
MAFRSRVPTSRLYFLARSSGSVNRARVSNSLWAGRILAAPCFASWAINQTRPLPPYNEPHNRSLPLFSEGRDGRGSAV